MAKDMYGKEVKVGDCLYDIYNNLIGNVEQIDGNFVLLFATNEWIEPRNYIVKII